jgi:archaellum component FlaC
MGALSQLRQAFEVAGRAIGFASEAQGGARRELVDSLEHVASRCDDAYTRVRAALGPVRDSYRDPLMLASALRAFAADADVRTSVKPHQLCGDVTALLDKLANNLDPLKYAIDVRRIKAVRESLGELHQLDYDIKNEYEEFTRDLDAVADQLDTAIGDEARERIAYVRQVIADFDRELSDLVTSVRDAKDRALAV